jgi:signal recognition particle GTPase
MRNFTIDSLLAIRFVIYGILDVLKHAPFILFIFAVMNEKNLYIIAGCNGAGKTTASQSRAIF